MSTFKCACGQTEAKLIGKPFLSGVCWCHSCVASSRFINEMEGNGTSGIVDSGGTGILMYKPSQVDFNKKPEAGFGGVKVGEKGKAFRCYSKCCNSQLFSLSNKFFALNPNCVYNEDGTKFEVSPPPLNWNKKYSFDPSAVPEPVCDTVPPFTKILPLIRVMINPIGPKVKDLELFPDDSTALIVPITWE